MDNSQNDIRARVSAVNRGLYDLILDDKTAKGRVSPALRTQIMREEAASRGNNPQKARAAHERAAAGRFPTVGDYVLCRDADSRELQITAIEPRTSVFMRANFGGHAPGYVKTVVGQAVAANFDYVIILTSLNQDFSLGRIERYLALAWQSCARPVIALTKADLSASPEEAALRVSGVAYGVPVYCLSAVTGMGIAEFAARFAPGDTLVFLGSSGVGKSSLVNALAGRELMRVNEIRQDDGRGRHTTTHRQLFTLPDGLVVIDTPGMREVGMWSSEEGVDMAFADVEQYFGSCRFNDCRHETEPGCAVLYALATGELPPERWESYQKLQREVRFAGDKDGYARQKRAFGKEIAKFSRDRSRDKGGKGGQR